MIAFHIAKAIALFWAISCFPLAIAADPASDSTRSASTDVASQILQGLASWTNTSNASITKPPTPLPTVYVPQADITWRAENFPKASVSHAQSCWSAYTSWYASYPNYYLTANISLAYETYSTLRTFVQPCSSTVWPTGNLSTYTLCDGTPRASYSPSTTQFDTSYFMEGVTVSLAYSKPIPEQFCTLNQADCAIMYFGTNANNLSEANNDNGWAFTRLLAACGQPLDTEVPCLVQGGPVELMYFPVSTEGGDLGGCIEGTTVTPTKKPAPITTLGTTFYPGTAYVSFETLYAAYRSLAIPGGAAVQIGTGFSNKIFEFRSDEISTNCYASVFSADGDHNPGYGHGTQLNFADLNYPPPASAYACQNQCRSVSYELSPDGVNVTTHTIHPNPCKTIFDNFNPLLAVPTRLREMHPEWASCRFWNHRQANIVFDPPVALTQEAVVARPTLPGGGFATTSAARPASTVGRLPSRTAAAMADNLAPKTADTLSEVFGSQDRASAVSQTLQGTKTSAEARIGSFGYTSGSSSETLASILDAPPSSATSQIIAQSNGKVGSSGHILGSRSETLSTTLGAPSAPSQIIAQSNGEVGSFGYTPNSRSGTLSSILGASSAPSQIIAQIGSEASSSGYISGSTSETLSSISGALTATSQTIAPSGSVIGSSQNTPNSSSDTASQVLDAPSITPHSTTSSSLQGQSPVSGAASAVSHGNLGMPNRFLLLCSLGLVIMADYIPLLLP